MSGNISFGLKFASRKHVLKHHKIVDEIIKYIIKIDPKDVILTDLSNLFNLAKEDDFINDTYNHFNIMLTSEQYHTLEMSDFIFLILEERKKSKLLKPKRNVKKNKK
jgi:hypothetical protein